MKLQLVVASLALAACSHAQPAAEAAPANPAPVAQPAPPPAPAPQPAAQPAPPIPVPAQSIYFDYDKSDLKPPAEEFLSRLGDILARYPDLHVRIEGNCDERGTEEYNLALGQRRADAAKKYLMRMGAREDQVTTISYGKDKPRATGHDESAWRENRRDDFIPSQATVPAKSAAVNR